MASNYPAGLDALNTAHVDNVGEVILAATDNDEADAINKIEAELGVNPAGVYTDVVTRLGTLETLTFNTQSGSTYTLVLADASLCVVFTNATSTTVTIPANATTAFLAGTQIMVRAGTGAGTVTISPAGGVTLVNPYSSFALAGPNAQAVLLKIGTNAWTLNGEVA